MRLSRVWPLAVILASVTAAAHAQGRASYPYNTRPEVAAATPTAPAASRYERASGRSNPALRYFGGGNAAVYRAPSRPIPTSAPMQARRLGKPFSGVQQTANVSPYLALDIRESEESIPNYYMFVKPQLEQQRLNHVQQAQHRSLQQQVRTASAGGAMGEDSGDAGIPTTGSSSQFMNSGGYYPQRK